ncbi:MAG: ABC transporter ATP-binding protein [Desulfuromonadales bacterium]|nr:ABC transporter ATP-binding protein [Desulfuromonadales bacterium]
MIHPLVTNGLFKTYQEGRTEVRAVVDVDLQLNEGEVIGLFGPSGSGKTTLLSLLGCILQPSGGSLKLFGQEIYGLQEKDLPPLRKRYISYIFQGFNLFPALTVYENVMLVLKIKGITGKQADNLAQAMIEEVGLAERIDFLPRDLSGGQKQRVAIARALAVESPLILADEPTANLDHVNGKKVMEILRSLAVEQKKCVVVATHDNRIEDIFDRILFMEDGRIVDEKKRDL